MLTLFERQIEQKNFVFVGVSEDKALKLCNYLKETILYWIKLFSDIAGSTDQVNKQVSKLEIAVLWAVVSCYPCFPHLQDNLVPIKDLIDKTDQLLETESGRY